MEYSTSTIAAFLQFLTYTLSLALLGGSLLLIRTFKVPDELAHLPKLPVLPLLYSYASGEVENARILRLILPFATKHNENVVVVYALGRWIVHILDYNMSKHVLEDIGLYSKEVPPDDMLLWRLIGRSNIILSNGDAWKRQSRVVKSALDRSVPIEEFASLAKRLFQQMESGRPVRWDDLTMRYALDALGTAALGYDFNAIADADSPFVRQYDEVMSAIASPAYILFPSLERWWPRKSIIQVIDNLADRFLEILREKKKNPGHDMLTYLLEEPGITDTEYRDNMVVFFIAGHDTSAGAMSSLVYFLAKHPHIQIKARDEVDTAMAGNTSGEPTLDELRKMPYVQACIRESLRINTPITYMVPRTAGSSTLLRGASKDYVIPAKASVILNICAIHHNETFWPDPDAFIPERFLPKESGEDSLHHWMPFALGPRQCPARNFAMYEMRTLAAMLLREWKWSLPKDSPHSHSIQNGFSPFALSLPKNLDVIFERRSESLPL